jgi:hypothetical protein
MACIFWERISAIWCSFVVIVGATVLAKALAQNRALITLSLRNCGLDVRVAHMFLLDLKWIVCSSPFPQATAGAIIGNALNVNRSLREIDLSYNQGMGMWTSSISPTIFPHRVVL